MKYIEFDVKNMAIRRTNGEKASFISGAVNYFGLQFNFDEEFAALPGVKVAEFFKNRNRVRLDLVDGKCAVPNEMLSDKAAFEMRVISGEMVATPWIQVAVTESGAICPEVPEEELQETLAYVKTFAGDAAVAMLRKGENGLEFSADGENFEGGINGIPDAPKTPKNQIYLRKNGDWVPYDPPKQVEVEGLTGTVAEIASLAGDAELSAVIAKVNEVIEALKDRGVTA